MIFQNVNMLLFSSSQISFHVCVCAQLCLTLCDRMDCSPPGSSVHGIPQARILEWVVISSSRASSQPKGQTRISCIGKQILCHQMLSHQGSPKKGCKCTYVQNISRVTDVENKLWLLGNKGGDV